MAKSPVGAGDTRTSFECALRRGSICAPKYQCSVRNTIDYSEIQVIATKHGSEAGAHIAAIKRQLLRFDSQKGDSLVSAHFLPSLTTAIEWQKVGRFRTGRFLVIKTRKLPHPLDAGSRQVPTKAGRSHLRR